MVKLPQGQFDLFIASASDVSPKAQQELMSRNWFSLAKQKRIKPIEHKYANSWVKITGNPLHGLATIFDNDILIFVIVSRQADAFNLLDMSFLSLLVSKSLAVKVIMIYGVH